MRAVKRVGVRFGDKVVSCDALLDSGSGITAVQRAFFEEVFGRAWSSLSRPFRVYWINGESIVVDKYVQLTILIDGFEFPETVFVIDDFVKEIEVEGRRIRLPVLIIGSGTMGKYGIILDPKEGVKVIGASLMI